jgi:hypothetical protein
MARAREVEKHSLKCSIIIGALLINQDGADQARLMSAMPLTAARKRTSPEVSSRHIIDQIQLAGDKLFQSFPDFQLKPRCSFAIV